MDNLVITVARGFGSCGKRIAKQIADDLGIHCYENRILMLALIRAQDTLFRFSLPISMA